MTDRETRRMLMCVLLRVEYNVQTRQATLYLRDNNCTDMAGAIEYCESKWSDVRWIQTWSGKRLDTVYSLNRGGWYVASDPVGEPFALPGMS